MENHIRETVMYSPNYRLGATYVEVFRFYFYALKKYKQFIWINFLKHFKASYQKSFLRVLWMILMPLIPVSVYIMLQQFGLLRGASETPKVIYVVVGMTFWQLFSNSLQYSMTAAAKEKAMLKKINMPFVLFHIAAMGRVIFDYLVRIVLIWVLLLGFDVSFNINWLLLPLMLVPLMMLGFTVGMFLSLFSVYFNDVENLTNIFIRYGLFASGVIFPVPKVGLLADILNMNPIFILLDNMRSLLVFSEFTNLNYFMLTIVLSVFMLIYTLKKLYVLESRMREYL